MDAAVPLGKDCPDCVYLANLFESRVVRVTAWRCLYDGPPLREERYFTDPVLTLAHSGASICHFGRHEILVDPTRVFLRNPRETYRTTHTFGCGDAGVNVRVRPDIVRGSGAAIRGLTAEEGRLDGFYRELVAEVRR